MKEIDEGMENEGVPGREEVVGEWEGERTEWKRRLTQVISSHFFHFSLFSSFFSTHIYELILISANNLCDSCQRMLNCNYNTIKIEPTLFFLARRFKFPSALSIIILIFLY
jgi:cellulose synthase/poly-beta-1,6-N-acetylglucosamine synthase-like glycosyltransferase